MIEQTIQIETMQEAMNVFGSFDANIKILEQAFEVSIINRGADLRVSGHSAEKVEAASGVLTHLLELASKGEEINEQSIRYLISVAGDPEASRFVQLSQDFVCITERGKPIKAKTMGQKRYIDKIENNTIVLGVGPAGTGKTYLAVAMAVTAFRNKEVNRIILTRPAVEAGEKLGFLPGDLQNKVDPYLRPLYDALYEMLGSESFHKYMERGSIEIAPLAYMRGRTLDDSFIILDEAQNTTPEQMKMFLTRIGFGSHAVITGDITQIDLPNGVRSGLKEAIKVLDHIEDIAIVTFDERDVVRHPLVQKIIKAYERYESRKEMHRKERLNKTDKQ